MQNQPTKVVGRRVLAFVIDLLIFAAVFALSWFALTKNHGSGACIGGGLELFGKCRAFDADATWMRTLWFVIMAVTFLLLWFILPGRGTSPGHAATGTRIVDEEGQPPGLLRGFGRGFFMWLIDASIVGLIVASVNSRNQRVGDLVVGTFVVDKNAAGQPVPGSPAALGAGYGGPPGQYGGPPPSGAPVYGSPPPQQAAPAEQHKADWYPDPHGQARLRYWDGQRWTEHTSA
jgi:uncharacterized RDD family membrane protein YckC